MKTRVKFRMMPGDVRKSEKIAMCEDRSHPFFGWLWKHVMRPRRRAVEKRQARLEMIPSE